MFYCPIADVAFFGRELRANAVLRISTFAAIDAATREHGGQFCNSDTVKLLRVDVVDALLLIGDSLFKADNQALGYLAEEDARLRDGVEKARPW